MSTAPVGGNRERKLWTFEKSNFKNQNFWKNHFEKCISKKSIFEKRKIQFEKKNGLNKKMVRVSSQKYPLLMASIFFFEKSILKQSNFEYRKIQWRKKTSFKKMIRASSQKYPLLMASNFFFLKNPLWNNPILNTGKSNEEKKRLYIAKKWSEFHPKHILYSWPHFCLKNTFWNNPILNTENPIWKKNGFKK